MKLYYKNITYDLCHGCTKCKYNFNFRTCLVLDALRFYNGNRLHPTEQFDVFEL